MEGEPIRKFRVVCYQRLDSGPGVPVAWEQAPEERKQLERLNPEKFYVLEAA
jgi:hypothetical protein